MYMKLLMKKATKYYWFLILIAGILYSTPSRAQNDDASQVDTTLTDNQMAAFSQQAKDDVIDFAGHVKHIADKNISTYLRKKYINNALALFSDPDVNIVEVSSLKDPSVIVRPSIKEYLFRLMNLPYTKVNITWYNFKISGFQKGKDGNYYATAMIFQKFSATVGNTEIHKQVNNWVKKSIQISLVKKQSYNGVKPADYWDVKLGDIHVQEATL